MLLLNLENRDSNYCIDLGKQKLNKTAGEISCCSFLSCAAFFILNWRGGAESFPSRRI